MAKKVHASPTTMADWAKCFPGLVVEYSTDLGVSLVGESDSMLASALGQALRGRVQLVFTSPPFPLNRKKAYDNKQGAEYKEWLCSYALPLTELLTPDGAIVLEVGNAWEPGLPAMSTLAMEALLEFKAAGKLYLCQEFIWYNPAKLPTPAQWVTVDRVRVKDAFTRIWWLSPTPHPKASNRRVLTPYSEAMKQLLRRKQYNSGRRPSEHVIGQTSFFNDNGGAIPSNFLEVPYAGYDLEATDVPDNVLRGSNTRASDSYLEFCRKHEIQPHPARMPAALAEFFTRLCTEPGDIVLDPFAGSNTTGAVAEALRRRWVSIEVNSDYAHAGRGRFAK